MQTPLQPQPQPHASAYCLDHIADDDLHAGTRRLVGRSNQLLALLLAHLSEVEARGIYRERACASLYTYCVHELRMSEDAAFRRSRAAKIAQQFPVLFEQIAAGEIHLTGVLMLGPHLTEENHLELLARAKHRTKKEIASLVRVLDPLPDVAASVQPLGPGGEPGQFRSGIATPRNPTWKQLAESFAPVVRELAPGDRPKDWIDDGEDDDNQSPVSVPVARATVEMHAESQLPSQRPASELTRSGTSSGTTSVAPQRYKVQFTATQEYVDLLEEARNLLAHAIPSRSLEEVHCARCAGSLSSSKNASAPR